MGRNANVSAVLGWVFFVLLLVIEVILMFYNISSGAFWLGIFFTVILLFGVFLLIGLALSQEENYYRDYGSDGSFEYQTENEVKSTKKKASKKKKRRLTKW